MQILIDVGDNLEETFKKVLDKSDNGYNFFKKDPSFRIIYDYEALPIDFDVSFEDYAKIKNLEKMQKILSKGSDPHDD